MGGQVEKKTLDELYLRYSLTSSALIDFLSRQSFEADYADRYRYSETVKESLPTSSEGRKGGV
jgi:hypothetical protein